MSSTPCLPPPTNNSDDNDDASVSVGIDLYTSGPTPSHLIRDHNANQPLSSLFPDPQSNLTFDSSTVSTLSDLFSTASIETPHSTLSSRSTKHDGPSFPVTHLNESDVAQATLDDLLTLATRQCAEAYYPLAEAYYLGSPPSRLPDKEKALYWYMKTTTTTNLPVSTIAWAQYRVGLILAKQGEVEKAVVYFELSADHDNRYAQYMLGLHYQHGLFMQQMVDLKQALYWYERAARNGFSDAQVSLGQLILDNLAVLDGERTKWIHLAIHWLDLAAKQNHVKAHVTLGGLYDEGNLIDRNPTLAIHHYEAAIAIDTHSDDVILAHYFVGIHHRLSTPPNHEKAKTHLELASGYGPAQRALGLMYLEQQHTKLAYEWLTKAAMQGDIQAMGLLGQQAERQNSEAVAIQMYQQAAMAGSVAAQLSLGTLLLRLDRRADAFPWFQMASQSKPSTTVGYLRQRNLARLMVARYTFNGWDTIKKNPSWAYQEFLQLSRDQLTEAHFWVAACYDEGIEGVVAQDPSKAFDYYLKSAEGGDIDGQFQVALILANGTHNKQKDPVQAFQWYCKAAERGHATAQYSVGLFYERGLVETNLDLAKMWYERASQQHHTTAMIALAQLLLKQDGDQEALHWLHKAATKDDDKNYTAALRALAGVFEQGKIAVALPDRYHKGWLLLQKAKQDPLAWVDMARYHELGLGVEKSLVKAQQCLLQAEKLGYQKARMALGDLHYRHKMWDEAFDAYDTVAKMHTLLKKPGWNSRLAIARLVLIEGHAKGNQQDIYDWLSTMVHQSGANDVILMEPLELLGICHEFGKGTDKHLPSAMECYKRAISGSTANQMMNWIQERTRFRLVEMYMQSADQYSLAWEQLQITKTHFNVMNHQCKSSRTLARTARFYIGYLLLHWNQLKSRSDEAHAWLTQAADEGDGNAAWELAQLYPESAKQRLEQGVSASHSGCMVSLALLLEGNDRCMELLDRAIELDDNPMALYHYGRLMYDTYLDDPKQHQQHLDLALDYYMKSAAKGNHGAMVRIGQLFDSLEQYDDAQLWFEQCGSEHQLAKIMLIKYQCQGLTSGDHTIQHLQDAVQIWWEQQDTLLDRMDRYTSSQICLFMAQQFSSEQWYKRSMDLSANKEAAYELGKLYESNGDLTGAMDWFRMAAEQWNDAESQYQLGMYHAHGLGNLEEINLVAAQRYLKLAAHQGNAMAKHELGSVMFRHAWHLWHHDQQYQRALKQFEQAAALVPEALVELGHLYHTGFQSHDGGDFCLIVQNYKQAFAYYSEAARQGNAKAALMLGSYYEEGYLNGMENLEEALTWYEKAYQWKCRPLADLAIGKLKHRMAEKLLLVDHQGGLDLQEEAYTWFEAIDDGCAKVMVALYHLKGWGRKRCDPVKGVEMLKQLVKDGDNEAALVELAICYDQGIGVQPDLAHALVYWEQAAQLGDDVVALRRTEEIYRLGLAGSCDPDKADEYGRRADIIECSKRNEREKSFCSTSSSSSSSYASRRSSLDSLNQLY
ncbi:hypothetical protein BC941DRAFT_452234 [Chlamydoabsidia padenii]|nr:hypothetical protein BC941DRAFT_452234 [Chlamydoabsidia padenii]